MHIDAPAHSPHTAPEQAAGNHNPQTTNMLPVARAKETHGTPKEQPTASAVVELLRDLTKAYTRHHEELKVNGGEMGSCLALTLQGHGEDHGKLVGERGANIWALTTVFDAIGRRLRKQVLLTLLEPVIGDRARPDRFLEDPTFKHNATTTLLRRTLALILAAPFSLSHMRVGTALHYEIRPDLDEMLVFRGELTRALHSIFHAIGKSRGCLIYVHLHDPDGQQATA